MPSPKNASLELKPKPSKMKKLFLILAMGAVLVSCGNKKKDEKKTGSDTAATTSTTTTTTTTTSTTEGVPTFSDPEVQQWVNDYTAFVNSYMNAAKDKDMAKLSEIGMKASDWTSKSLAMTQKLAANPDEAKKFSDYMTKLSAEWAEAAKALVPKMQQ